MNPTQKQFSLTGVSLKKGNSYQTLSIETSMAVLLLGVATALSQPNPNKPAFVLHPQSVMVPIKDTVQLSCLATGTPPITYFWVKDASVLGGQTNASLVITNAQASDSGRYAAIALNDYGVKRSQLAEVVVYTASPGNFPWVWMKKFPTTRDNCYAYASDMIRDNEGNIYVTGAACMAETDLDYLTVKLTPSGEVIWSSSFDDPSHNGDYPQAIAIDSAGNCYVTGYSYSLKLPTESNNDYLTIKYGPNGEQLWAAHFDSTTNTDANVSNDEARSIKVDDLGCVYVTGNHGTLKYAPDGKPLWTNISTGWLMERSRPDGGVIVADTHTLTKISDSGTNIWNLSFEKIECITADAAGNTYVVSERGFDWQGSTGDIETAKISKDGQRLWTAIYDSEFHLRDEPGPIAVDSHGSVLVGGVAYRTNSPVAQQFGAIDMLLLKYDADGNLTWARRFNDTANREEIPSAIAIDSEENVYLAGTTASGPTGEQRAALMVKYDAAGNRLWTSRYAITPYANNYFVRVSVGNDGMLFAAGLGTYQGDAGQYRSEFLVAGYDQRTPRLVMTSEPAPQMFCGWLISLRWTQFEIVGTTNLLNGEWQNVGKVTNYNGLVSFHDAEVGRYPMRFYRAIQKEP